MLARIRTSAINGIAVTSVDVEVHVREGVPNFTIIGLADSAVRESRDRVISAIRQSGFELPDIILVNLAPAELRKEGSGFDLSIALAILLASGQVRSPEVQSFYFHGELSLDGSIRPVRGAVALAAEARERHAAGIVVPCDNTAEASVIEGLGITSARTLRDLVDMINDGNLLGASRSGSCGRLNIAVPRKQRYVSEVRGQTGAKRAMLVAAAGGHNLLMVGPPGCGKSMLAERFSSVLPELDSSERLEVARLHSIAGLPVGSILGGLRPYRNPNQSASEASLLGGGTHARPGEVTLAHRGVLFLDEFPEFRRSAIEALRTPLESGEVNITRVRARVAYPARFQLLAAMNPCPCGRLGVDGSSCSCPHTAIKKYLSRLSQPILDRIDLQVELEAVPLETMFTPAVADWESEDRELRGQVMRARDAQILRQQCLNRDLSSSEASSLVNLEVPARTLVRAASKKIGLTARGYFRVLKVARTIADLEAAATVQTSHIAEALAFRALERIREYCRI